MSRLLNCLLLPSTHSSNVYAVNRNTEGPAKMTPLIPPPQNTNSKVSSVMEAEENQVDQHRLAVSAAGSLFSHLFFILTDAECELLAFKQQTLFWEQHLWL